MATLSPLAWLSLAIQVLAYYAIPLILWISLTRRLGVSWKMVRLGAFSWLSALPFIIAAPIVATMIFQDPQQRALAFGVALSFAAGIAEETSRYLYYRKNPALRDPDNLREAVVAGAGHGGTEALVLGLQYAIGPAIMFLFFAQNIPAEMRDSASVTQFFLINSVARIIFLFNHIGLTLLVWKAVSLQRPWYWGLAIVLHIVIDLMAFVLPILIPGTEWLIALPLAPLTFWALFSISKAWNQLPTPAIAD